MDWGEFSQPESKPWSKKTANKFLLCCLLDYQVPSEAAWRNGYRLIEDILDDPDDRYEKPVPAAAPEFRYHLYHGGIRLPFPEMTECAVCDFGQSLIAAGAYGLTYQCSVDLDGKPNHGTN
jgi:hypothetical protein